MEEYKVYIRLNDNLEIVEINSSAFVFDSTGWLEIDSGFGDRFHHAQGNYLDKPIVDEFGRLNYRFIDSAIIEVAEEDKPIVEEAITISTDERIDKLEEALTLLLEGVTE